MSQETKKQETAELQYCVQCPTCNETFKVKPSDRTFTQMCVFCKHSFEVIVKKPKHKGRALALGIGV